MVGFITERDLTEAEEAFPGIVGFYESLAPKPCSFLELLSRFERWPDGMMCDPVQRPRGQGPCHRLMH